MTDSAREPSPRRVPPRQHNFEQAADLALSAVRAQPHDQLTWLGARREDDLWRLEVLDDLLGIDLRKGGMFTSDRRPVGVFWKVVVLHYLAVADRPAEKPPELTFANLPGGRAYAPVYEGRVIRRLCGTFGSDADALRQAGRALGGSEVDAGDVAFEFMVFPRLRLRVVWYAGDEELPPSATILLPENIERWLCVEDIVVLSERLVSRLTGRGF